MLYLYYERHNNNKSKHNTRSNLYFTGNSYGVTNSFCLKNNNFKS